MFIAAAASLCHARCQSARSVSQGETAATTLPARLRYARDESLRRQFTKCQPRDFETANEGAPPSRDLATVDHPRRTGITRKLEEPGVVLLRLELGPERRVLFNGRAFAFV